MKVYSENIENQKEKEKPCSQTQVQTTTTIIVQYTPSWCISSQLQNTSNEMASFENKNCFPKWFEGPETWIELLCPEDHLAFIYFVFQNPGRILPLICNQRTGKRRKH